MKGLLELILFKTDKSKRFFMPAKPNTSYEMFPKKYFNINDSHVTPFKWTSIKSMPSYLKKSD